MCNTAGLAVVTSASRGLGHASDRVHARTWISPMSTFRLFVGWRRVQPIRTHSASCSHCRQRTSRVLCSFHTELRWATDRHSTHAGVLRTSEGGEMLSTVWYLQPQSSLRQGMLSNNCIVIILIIIIIFVFICIFIYIAPCAALQRCWTTVSQTMNRNAFKCLKSSFRQVM